MKYRLNLLSRPDLLFCALIVFWLANPALGGRPAAPAGQTVAEMQSLSGMGEHFEVILKFPSFAIGSDVPLTAYVLDGATNEPIQGATVSGGMSSGAESIAVPFTETAQPTPGAYRASVRGESDKPSSWLFDILVGEKSDLVAIDGFNAGDKDTGPPVTAPPDAKETGSGITLTLTEMVVLIAFLAVLQAAIFLFIRKRCTSSASAKDSR
jgi:hypothetical protein